LQKKAGRWMVAAELVDTTRLYARTIAQIQPEWLERVGAHLLKKSYGEPRWEKRGAQVVASERATLHGLVVYSQRRISYGAINPVEAREIFIRDALVGGDFDTRAPFLAHNQKLVREIENLEHKSRRLDVLVDDDLIAAFYDELLPEDVHNGADFEKWYRKAGADNPRLLYLNREDLMRHEAAGITTDLFPKTMRIAGVEMGLTYHFEPGAARDGVTLAVPLFALNQVSAERAEWLVPGMLKEKAHLLLKSLPQKLRRHCVPLPDYAAGFNSRVHERKTYGRGSLLDALIADVREQTGVIPRLGDFKPETLPAHHFMNFKVIDEHGRQLDMGRNLAALQAEFGGQAREQFQKLAEQTVIVEDAAPAANRPAAKRQPADDEKTAAPGAYQNLTTWSFGELPELLEIQQGKQKLIGFPALVDRGSHCDLEVFDDPAEAARMHRNGMRRLFALQLKEQIKFLEKNIAGLQQMGMQYMALGSQEELRDQIIEAGLDRACLQEPLPRNAEEFSARRDQGKARLGLLVNEIARLAGQVLAEFHALPKKLQGARAHAQAVADIQSQVQALVGKRFIVDTDYAQLSHYPRYLKAIGVRLEKLRADPARDAKLLAEWQQAAAPWQRAQKGQAARDPKMLEYRWLLEELRVSLFAQELKTPMPISAKRLQKVWEALQR
jgi:ATP-dependent helicase HrpA